MEAEPEREWGGGGQRAGDEIRGKRGEKQHEIV